MRKSLILLTALSYLVSTHYCLAYAAITGHAHGGAETMSCHGEASEAAEHHHDGDCPSHHEGSQGQCCNTFSCQNPTLVPSHVASLEPQKAVSYSLLALVSIQHDVTAVPSVQNDTGPPGSYQDLYPSAVSLRAPPSTTSL